MGLPVITHLRAYCNCKYGFGKCSTELILPQDSSYDSNFQRGKCLIKFNISDDSVIENPLYNFENSSFYRNIVFNEHPELINQLITN